MILLRNHRIHIVQASLLVVWLLLPIWLKWPDAPAPFTARYVLGFVISAAMLGSVLLWSLCGWPNGRHLFRNRWLVVWWGSLLALILWVGVSRHWSFLGSSRPEIAHNALLHYLLLGAFLLTVAATASRRWLLYIFVLSLLLHGLIGGMQVGYQSAIGMEVFNLNPADSGVSVIQAGEVRWLRPYGLLPHPNIYAGMLVIGLIAAASLLLRAGWARWVGVVAFCAGFWMLLLSFSRGAWIGFAAGILFALAFVVRRAGIWRKIALPCAICAVMGIGFFLLYQPFLQARVGVGTENTELRSVADRIVYIQIAEDAIRQQTWLGIGAHNFPWYAADYLFFRTDYDLRGDNVHNVALLIWSELGLVGVALLLVHGSSAAVYILQRRDLERITLLAGAFSWLVIGLVEHYPWTLIQTQTLWLGLLAAALAPDARNPASPLATEPESDSPSAPQYNPHL